MSFRSQPVSNRLCAAADRARSHASHRQRIQSNPPTVDDTPPKTYFIHINRAKKEQMLDDMCDKIDRENRLLLKKMDDILHSHTLDVVHSSPKRSLNEGQRRREMKKIMAENHAILERINVRKAHYDREEWHQHRLKHDAYLENIRVKPIPPDPIPSPRFIRDGSMTARPRHAYMNGNYSVAKMKSETQQLNQNGSASGSQSARMASAGSSSSSSSSYHHTPTPNRTGASRQHGQRMHTLQPMPPTSVRSPTNASSNQARALHSPSSNGGNKSLSKSQSKSGHIPILRSGRNFGDAYVILAVHEVPGVDGEEEKQNDTNLPSYLSSLDSSTTNPPSSSSHALLFSTYDPLESDGQSVSVPWPIICQLPEIRQQSHLVQPTAAASSSDERIQLATLLSERLELVENELRFRLDKQVHAGVPTTAFTSADQSSAVNEHKEQLLDSHHQQEYNGELQATEYSAQPAEYGNNGYDHSNAAYGNNPNNYYYHDPSTSVPLDTDSAAHTNSQPSYDASNSHVNRSTHPVAYTDSMGVDYYFDAQQNAYLPYPGDSYASSAVSSHDPSTFDPNSNPSVSAPTLNLTDSTPNLADPVSNPHLISSSNSQIESPSAAVLYSPSTPPTTHLFMAPQEGPAKMYQLPTH